MNLPPEHKLLLISWQQQSVKAIPVKTVRCPAGSNSARERDIGFRRHPLPHFNFAPLPNKRIHTEKRNLKAEEQEISPSQRNILSHLVANKLSAENYRPTTLTKATESAHNGNVKLQMWICGVDPDGDTTVL
jgi:hypothetical protein